jgi:biotin carboxyl carrier protein
LRLCGDRLQFLWAGSIREKMSIEAVTARVQQILTMEQQLSNPATALPVTASSTAGASAAGASVPASGASVPASGASTGTTQSFAATLAAAQAPSATAAPTIQTAVGPSTNPVPGATGSRLDQGFDGTTKSFVAPFSGTVVYSSANDPGWAGGGYVAIKSATDPSKVFFAAEGLLPTVKVGDTVSPGQTIAHPATNPYNGIEGNFEIGWANPSSPGQPLAQVASDPKQVALDFYSWVRSLGGPTATSTSNAGYA